MVTPPDQSPVPHARTRFGWLRAASDRVPTRWFAAIGTGLFLAATAAFGGLATAAEPGPAVLADGATHRNDQLSIQVERAVLIDEFPDAGVYVEDGERVLALVVTVENEWTQPLPTSPGTSVAKSFTIEGLTDGPDSTARLDDATVGPWLQPGVPAQIVVTWAVDADRFEADQTLTVTLNDLTLYTGSFVTSGQWWTGPVPAATTTVVIEDVGAGA